MGKYTDLLLSDSQTDTATDAPRKRYSESLLSGETESSQPTEAVKVEEKGLWGRFKDDPAGTVKDLFTGDSKKTDRSETTPEISSVGVDKLLGDKVPTHKKLMAAAALLSTFDPKEQFNIIKNNADPEDRPTYFEDEKGNSYVNVGGRQVALNSPGNSAIDNMQMVAQGALFTPAGKAAAGAITIPRAMARVGAASAATQGGISAVGEAAGRDASAGTIAGEVATAGVLGGVFEGLLQGLGKVIPGILKSGMTKITPEIRAEIKLVAEQSGVDPNVFTDDLIRKVLGKVNKSTDPKEVLAIALSEEFGIPYTSGQRTLDPKQLSFEDTARVGGFGGILGDRAQDEMTKFGTAQGKAVNNARAGIIDTISGGKYEGQQQAMAVAKQGLKSAEEAANTRVREAFESVGDAELTANGFRQLLTAVKKSVSSPDFVKSKTLAPASAELLGQINQFQNLIKGTGNELKPQNIKQIEQMRRTIGAHIEAAANNSDRRTLTTMKHAFDDYIDTAIARGLINGDDVGALKTARSIFREYAQAFRANPQRTKGGRMIPDKAGELVDKIVSLNPTDTEVLNSMFGASGISKEGGVQVAQRFKKILGPESEGWQQVRAAAFDRLIKTNKFNGEDIVSGSKTLSAIDDAERKAPELLKEIFSNEELAKIKRFALAVKRTQPDIGRSTEAPSGTAQKMFKTAAQMLPALAGMHGGLSGLLAGNALNMTISVTKGGKAAQAVRPFSRVREVQPALIGGSVGLSQDYRGQPDLAQ